MRPHCRPRFDVSAWPVVWRLAGWLAGCCHKQNSGDRSLLVFKVSLVLSPCRSNKQQALLTCRQTAGPSTSGVASLSTTSRPQFNKINILWSVLINWAQAVLSYGHFSIIFIAPQLLARDKRSECCWAAIPSGLH